METIKNGIRYYFKETNNDDINNNNMYYEISWNSIKDIPIKIEDLKKNEKKSKLIFYKKYYNCEYSEDIELKINQANCEV